MKCYFITNLRTTFIINFLKININFVAKTNFSDFKPFFTWNTSYAYN